MALGRNLALATAVAMSCLATGCVGPMACGPAGCDARGPLAFNDCDGCGACDGCGELYIDPWINHPADACDPCDRCGNYNGQSCGKCRSVFSGFRSLWGYRCEPGPSGCDVGGGCDSIGGCDGCGNCGGGQVWHSQGMPTPAPEVIIEEGPPESVQPAPGENQIFRPRQPELIEPPAPEPPAAS